MPRTTWIVLGTVIAAVSLFYKPVVDQAQVIGLMRPPNKIVNLHGQDLRTIDNTQQCEDLHVHHPSGLLFAACQTSEPARRHYWFPPLTLWTDPEAGGEGTIVIINPKDFSSTPLTLTDFSGSFITHGIDLYWNEDDPSSVYIFAVNHLPNPDYRSETSKDIARSQIELFHHQIGSSTAQHLRSIIHPLIRTPNDILATSASTFYITNDHYYRSGHIRTFEDLGSALASWSDIVYITLTSLQSPDPFQSLTATPAITILHNPNGLGHGSRYPNETMIIDASGGILMSTILPPPPSPGSQVPVQKSFELRPFERIRIPSTLDNPSYYSDPYPDVSGDASGYILAGLLRAADIASTAPHFIDRNSDQGAEPGVVWYVKPDTTGSSDDGYTKRILFQDTGKVIRSMSTAVVVGIDPEENQGRKQGWLFVTGYFSFNIVVAKVDL